ncbi:MAG: hypothetical protein HZA88_08375 [Verrucomicrobia bacterium]|nr:hypothetical protein [Verrucomicrobiota bacterium]
MKLAVTIDVEEEGLFSGRYETRGVSVKNVAELPRLDSIFREWNIAPTLLLAHSVASHEPHRDLLLKLKQQWNAEIGAHLHPWNTPPLQASHHPEPVSSELIPRELLDAKLHTLLQSIRQMGITPTSFRMGRFNIGPRIFSLLEGAGILVDSSVAPMRRYHSGSDRLAAPADPYFPDDKDTLQPGRSNILEVPITILSIFPQLVFLLEQLPAPKRWASWLAMNLGSLAAQPMWNGLKQLKAATRLHQRRGGQVLTLYFHSSELMPGGCPQHPTPQHVDRFLARLRNFFEWLHREGPVESRTLSQLGNEFRQAAQPPQMQVEP